MHTSFGNKTWLKTLLPLKYLDQYCTLLLRDFLAFSVFSEYRSSESADTLLKKVGSEYLLKQDPGPPVSNLIDTKYSINHYRTLYLTKINREYHQQVGSCLTV